MLTLARLQGYLNYISWQARLPPFMGLINTGTAEMEFLDLNLRKDSSLWLPAIHNLFYWRILKKTIHFSRLKNSENSVFMNIIL